MPKTKTFLKISREVSKTYLNKPVPMKFQSKYGKLYDKDEVKSIAYAIAKNRGIKTDR